MNFMKNCVLKLWLWPWKALDFELLIQKVKYERISKEKGEQLYLAPLDLVWMIEILFCLSFFTQKMKAIYL